MRALVVVAMLSLLEGPASAQPVDDPCAALVARALKLGSGPDASSPTLKGAAADLARRKALTVAQEISALEGVVINEVPLRLPWARLMVRQFKEETSSETVGDLMKFAGERLAATCAAHRQEIGTGAPVDTRLLAEILARPEYELRSSDDFFLFRMLDRIRLWLRDVVATSRSVTGAASLVRTLFLVAVCFLVGLLAWRLARIRVSGRRRAAPGDVPYTVVLADPARYDEAADLALSRGDGREAIRLALLALVAALERLRLASPGRAWTNRELVARLELRGATKEVALEAKAVIDWYDRAWYGLARVSAEDASGFAVRVRELRLRAQAAVEKLKEGAS